MNKKAFEIKVTIKEPEQLPTGGFNKDIKTYSFTSSVKLIKNEIDHKFRREVESTITIMIQKIMIDFLLDKEINKRFHKFGVEDK